MNASVSFEGESYFATIDYSVFIIILMCSLSIGIYFGFFSKELKTAEEYLIGGHNMKPVPVAISLIASQLSAISIMALPAEIYSFGYQYIFLLPTLFFVTLVTNYISLPVFYCNNIENCYAYLEIRFGKITRRLLTGLYIILGLFFFPLLMYIPSLAFVEVTKQNILYVNIIVSYVCVTYTMLGGIKAVVWTDVLQAFVMVTSCVIVAFLGVQKTGGTYEVIDRAIEGGRLFPPNMSMDLTTRITFWNSVLPQFVGWTCYISFHQNCAQRLISLPTLEKAKRAMIVFFIGVIFMMGINSSTGLIMYSFYHGCDPVRSGTVTKYDKLMPRFVQDVAGHIPGMSGIFISCVFSASLSTVSAGLHATAGIIYSDYVRPFNFFPHNDANANRTMRIIIMLLGSFCAFGAVFIERFHSIFQIINTVGGITVGTKFGVFTIGMLYPFANQKGVLTGIIVSVAVVLMIVINTQYYISEGKLIYNVIPTSIDKCSNETLSHIPQSAWTLPPNEQDDDGFAFYKISFQWYPLIGSVVFWVAAVLGSYLTGGQDLSKLNPQLLSPFVQKMLPKKYRHTELKPIEKKISNHEEGDKEIVSKQELAELITQNDDKINQIKIMFENNLSYITDTISEVDNFTGADYGILVIILSFSLGIGVYFGCFSDSLKTAEDYLVGSHKMKSIPVAISIVASQISAYSIIAIPAEIYSFGWQYLLIIPTMVFVVCSINFLFLPVFYQNNIDNCYAYLELRFSKSVRKFTTLLFITLYLFYLPVVMFIPSASFVEVTKHNIHVVNTIVAYICVFYTMLGGIKAVVWTDVLQAFVMIASVVVVAFYGVSNVGGLTEVWNRAVNGNRISLPNFVLDSVTRTTFWNTTSSVFIILLVNIGFSQSCIQRLVSLPSLKAAQKSVYVFFFGFLFIMSFTCGTGIILYAYYQYCDPVSAGIVTKYDKMMPRFVQEVTGHITGMSGIFISCVFSASLSTISAGLHSISGVIYNDYIRPKKWFAHTDANANLTMGSIIFVLGTFCAASGIVVEQFQSIFQVLSTVAGVSTGAVFGVFTLGMLYPFANKQGVLSGMIISMLIMLVIIINAQYQAAQVNFHYEILPTRIDGCNNETIAHSQKLTPSTLSHDNNEGFAFYKIAFQWYPLLGVISMWIPSVIISYLTGGQDFKKFNAQLLSPCVRKLLPIKYRHTELKLIKSQKAPADDENEDKFMTEMNEWISKKEERSIET
ncbi:uncharacterized protein LOC116339681 [Contarinia nasturtii]|uniref:uncharacterized protein LOC116339681 n=1 Tax=Contarinia nasturtii TaxID=265458 RepID=UPI0012D4BC88|nr:uncharacterized protein LOC116339681 [Contarinia nasturtii]